MAQKMLAHRAGVPVQVVIDHEAQTSRRQKRPVCPVEIMRREHMNFLLHQRDATVHDGERGSQYSLTGCMDCHNPSESAETAVRYSDPEHFCAGCHIYASVKIDCFECHADRGLTELQQGLLDAPATGDLSALQTFRAYSGAAHVE